MAADVLSERGHAVTVYDAMPSVGRKFLLAGVGGMNITHAEEYARFVARYGSRTSVLRPWLDGFGPDALREFIHRLGIDTFVGSSGRVFPTDMKAAPLLRAWLHRLRERGVDIRVRHRWLGWDAEGRLRLVSPDGEITIAPSATVLALGGGSWPRLGSDGAWLEWLSARGVALAPLQPANCGFETAWSEHFRERFAGEPVKPVIAGCRDANGQWLSRQGEILITGHGLEGGLIYALSSALRDAIARDGQAELVLDLSPGRDEARLVREISHPRGSRSMASHLQSRAGIAGVKAGLLRECLPADTFADPQRLARGIKALSVKLTATRPLAEAISSAGGVCFEAIDASGMLNAMPGVFCAGEMLDWEAPTGGYLLTACFASGRAAGLGVHAWLAG